MDKKSTSFKYGRKVLFLNASSAIIRSVIPELVSHEFDVCHIPSMSAAKEVLAHFPGVILIVNLDDSSDTGSMIQFINSLGDDGSIETPTICVMYRGLDFDIGAFSEKASFTGGAIQIKDTANSLEPIITTLNSLNAKGMRKFVRTDCTNDKDAILLAIVNNKLYNLKCSDISLAGTACTVDEKFAEAFQPKTLINNITITLGRRTVNWPMIVAGASPAGDTMKLVLMFVSGISATTEKTIHDYIMQSQQKQIDNICTLAEAVRTT